MWDMICKVTAEYGLIIFFLHFPLARLRVDNLTLTVVSFIIILQAAHFNLKIHSSIVEYHLSHYI